MSIKIRTHKITAWLLTLAMLMTVLSGFSITAFAAESASGTCGENLSWTLDEEGTLTISGTGAMADYDWEENLAPWADYKIITVVIESGVTTIGAYAFDRCSELTSVTIPAGVETIETFTFYCCDNLESVTISEGVKNIKESAFSGCKKLESVTFPESLEVIGIYAFYDCESFTSVIIPEGVKTIGEEAFYECSGLTSIEISSTVESIGDRAFYDCESLLTIEVSEENENYTSIDGILFSKDETTLLKCPEGKTSEFIIPDGTVTIAEGAFRYCEKLESVTIPSSVAAIPEKAFYGCSGLISVDISEGIKTIGGQAFYECSSLATITIPSSITSIGDWAFSDCDGIIVYMKSEEPAELGVLPFHNGTDTVNMAASKIIVPADAVEAYIDDWYEYEDIIEPGLVDVSYIDENGDTQVCTDYTVVDSDITNWSEGWYVVTGDVTVNSNITASGDIHLILTDGSKLTVITAEKKGIYTDGNLSIYAQSDEDNMGELDVKSSLTGSNGIDAGKTLNISGGVIVAEGGGLGISAENITISGGDIDVKSADEESAALYAANDIEITDGAIETTSGELGYGIYSFEGNIAISGGSVKAAGDGSGIVAFGYAENDVYTENGNITISGGIVDAYTEAEGGIGIYARGTVNIYCDEVSRYPIQNPYFTGTINSSTNDGCAIYGSEGITVGNMLAITTPEDGVVKSFSDEDESFYAVAQSDEDFAADVTIKPVLYSIIIENLTSTTMKIDVPVGRSVNAAYKDFCRENYGTDNFSEYLDGYTAKDGYIFDGFYTESGEKFDFDAPVNGDMTITPKWTKKSSGGGGGVTRYTVKFETNGGSAISNKAVTKNSKIAEPTAPTKEGYSFVGWFTDEELTTAYDFDSMVTNAFTLYAKWEKQDDETPVEVENPFADVNASDWYYEDVIYVVENGLFKGTTETAFAPNDKLTRAMLVTILYRAEGEPEIANDTSFTDVDMGAYYANAVAWAQQNGIVNGVSETEFAPNDNITREQIAAIMHRYAQYKGYDVAVGGNTNILSYSDFDSVSEYAIGSMQYAVGSGLIKGKSESTLNPQDFATRAEISAILHRFIEANK